jgi:hypothetical protein
LGCHCRVDRHPFEIAGRQRPGLITANLLALSYRDGNPVVAKNIVFAEKMAGPRYRDIACQALKQRLFSPRGCSS